MRRFAKAGLVLLVVGAAVYGLPVLRYDYPTHVPLSAPFQVERGAVFRRGFTVRTSERYEITLGCRDVPPLNYSLSDFVGSGSNSPRIPCDIELRLLRRAEALQSAHLEVLRPANFSDGTGYWHLAEVHLPSAGRYMLEISNRSDLILLAPTGPVVHMDIGGAFYESAIFSKLLGLAVGAPVAFIGIILFLCGLRPGARAEPSASPNGGPMRPFGASSVTGGPPSVS